MNYEATSSNLDQFLEKMLKKTFTWQDAYKFLQFQSDDSWDPFFENVYEKFSLPKRKEKNIKVYVPGREFPSISLTGKACALNCEHCDRKYLSSMIPAATSSQLKTVLANLSKSGKVGTLLSGGCDAEGKVNYSNFVQVIQDFKQTPEGKKFYLNSHVGLVSTSEAQELAKIGIDAVSFDLNLDSEVITNIFHLKHSPEDYQNSFEALLNNGINVIPHILIGANFGRIKGELTALKYLNRFQPEIIVFIVMIPPRRQGVMDSRFSLVSPQEVAKIILISHYFFPHAEISLGCMRPYWNDAFHTEKWAIQAGVSRMVKPTMKTRQWLENESFKIEKLTACCVIPYEMENVAKKD
ncbi:MAG: hypothetical protein DRO88_04900 [Promethearchaeia archaeon]|nr:MAG: hypothetical protein DRO88_04900 [Candidatus Lokiarchaeia archaeon]